VGSAPTDSGNEGISACCLDGAGSYTSEAQQPIRAEKFIRRARHFGLVVTLPVSLALGSLVANGGSDYASTPLMPKSSDDYNLQSIENLPSPAPALVQDLQRAHTQTCAVDNRARPASFPHRAVAPNGDVGVRRLQQSRRREAFAAETVELTHHGSTESIQGIPQ